MKRLLARIDTLQRRHPRLATAVAVFKRFGEHGGSRLSAVVSYFSFFSVFPLLLAFVTVLGLVLEDRPTLRDDLVDGALGQIPVIGDQIGSSQQPLTGSVVALVLGLAAALWAGLGAATALQHGMDEVWDVPVRERPNAVVQRLKAIAALVLLGGGTAAATMLSNLATLFDLGPLTGALGVAATFAVNTALLVALFTLLTTGSTPWRQLLPGAAVGAVALVALHQIGSFVVRRYIAGASDTYGTFAVVIALLSWFLLVARAILMSAQINAVLVLELHPRSLLPGGEMTDADRRAILLDAQRVQRDPRVGVAVAVGDGRASDR